MQYTYLPACSGNRPGVESADVGCAQADAACPGEAVMHWLFQAPAGATDPGAWRMAASRCLAAAAAAEAGTAAGAPVIPAMTLADLRRLPLPAGVAHVQPPGGYTLVTMPTNVYATADPVVLDTTLLGVPVQVRATPSRYAWDFGDGTSHGPSPEPGAPYPDLRVAHAYEAAGPYEITLTTSYRGEFSVAGGPWLPVVGEAEVVSDPVPVTALAGRNRLVAGDADD